MLKKQQELSEKTSDKTTGPEQLKEKQKDLNSKFSEIKKGLQELEKKNGQLDNKSNYNNPLEEQLEIEKEQQESLKSLDDKNKQQASQNQKSASQKMQQLSKKLSDMQQQGQEMENEINMKGLRQLLDNLVKISFDQEKVMQTLKVTGFNDPNYIRQTQEQKGIQDNMKMIRDSLYSLSKRIPQIESAVNKEILAINKNISEALGYLSDRVTPAAARNQQYAMTSMNNLALMLSEVLEQLQKAQQNAKSGGKGKSRTSLSQLSKMQEQLNKNMEKARQEMQRQGNQSKGQTGKNNMSQALAKMAREQQMIRQSLQEFNREFNKDGKGKLGNLDKVMKEMEETETDLVNKRIKTETLLRQQQVLTKLLDAEKAEREREQDKQRESQTALEHTPNYKQMLRNYQKIKQSETELLRTIPPDLNSFYKLKVGDYFKLLNSGAKND